MCGSASRDGKIDVLSRSVFEIVQLRPRMTEDPRARRLPWFAASWCPGPPPAPRRRSLSWVWAAPFPVPLRCRAAAEGKSRKPRCPSPCGPRDLPKVGAALQLMLAPGTRGGVELFWAVVSRAFSPGLCRASHAFQPWALRWEGDLGHWTQACRAALRWLRIGSGGHWVAWLQGAVARLTVSCGPSTQAHVPAVVRLARGPSLCLWLGPETPVATWQTCVGGWDRVPQALFCSLRPSPTQLVLAPRQTGTWEL